MWITNPDCSTMSYGTVPADLIRCIEQAQQCEVKVSSASRPNTSRRPLLRGTYPYPSRVSPPPPPTPAGAQQCRRPSARSSPPTHSAEAGGAGRGGTGRGGRARAGRRPRSPASVPLPQPPPSARCAGSRGLGADRRCLTHRLAGLGRGWAGRGRGRTGAVRRDQLVYGALGLLVRCRCFCCKIA